MFFYIFASAEYRMSANKRDNKKRPPIVDQKTALPQIMRTAQKHPYGR